MIVNHILGREAGYQYFVDTYGLNVVPNWHISGVAKTGAHTSSIVDGKCHEIYPSKYWPGEGVGDQLEFALKYDGVNLAILGTIFDKVSQDDILDYVKSKPTGKYARRIWFFYELLTGKNLPLDDIGSGNYVEALDSDRYYTTQNGIKSQRHRVINNLLGPAQFCPTIRKTETLKGYDSLNLRERCEGMLNAYPKSLLRRALGYLYNKETKSSFEIENIKPNAKRIDRFIALLEQAETQDFCDKDSLIDLQNRIVDPRFADSDYRKSQNYVGQTVSFQKELVHFVSPKPKDLHQLMQGLIDSHSTMKQGQVPAVLHAAAIAYGFVFLHPFEDGNGRIHRFLIHNILSVQGIVPKGLMFPVSAVMLKNPVDYDSSLEAFSKPLLKVIDFDLDDVGVMTVSNETVRWYQYIDLTAQVEALYDFVIKTIDEELDSELRFLANYDETKRIMQDIIDMPDRLFDLFIQLCLQNKGRLSAKKRAAHFEFLTEDELKELETAVQEGFK